MAYPIMAPSSTWFAPNVTTITRSIFTEIEIMDSYTPDESVTVTDSWDASAAKDGSITCYVIGTKLIIAGNGSGKIALNENSMLAFSSTPDVTDITDIFISVANISNTNLLDFSLVKDAAFMFAFLLSLTSIDVSTWNVDNITIMTGMFIVTALRTITGLSNWNVSNVTNVATMFSDCQALTSIGDISNWNTSKVTNMGYMFSNCRAFTSLNLSNWNVSNVTSMEHMFSGCQSLTSLDLSNWNTSSLQNTIAMLQDCTKLKDIDLSGFDFSKTTDMSFMFYGCSSLGEIDVTNWDVSNCISFDHFAAHAKLKRKGIENWNTKSAVNMNAMFHNCAEEELDLSGFDTSKVQFFSQMFENSPNLKRIKGLEKWDTSSGLGFEEMFERCYKLEEVDLSSFDTSKAKNNVEGSKNGHKTATLNHMFYQCNNLRKIALGPKFSINGDGSNTSLANMLAFPAPSAEYIEGADGNWYDCLDNTYDASNIPDRTANTYYAILDEAFESDTTPMMVKRGTLTKIAHAIRAKTGKANKILFKDFASEIEAYEGDIVLVSDTDMLIVEDGVLIAEPYVCGDTICGQGITGGEEV